MISNDENSYETVELTYKGQHKLNGEKVSKVLRWLIYTIAGLSVICMILGFCLIPLSEIYENRTMYLANGTPYTYEDYIYQGAFITMFPAVLQIVFAAIPTIIYLRNKQQINKSCYIAFICCIPIYMGTSFLAIFGAATSRVHILLILMILISFSLLALNIVVVVMNCKLLHTKQKQTVVTSSLEIKLNEIKRLLENHTITQSEYDQMREKIIAEYK